MDYEQRILSISKSLSNDKFIEFMDQLPPENTREFENALTLLAVKIPNSISHWKIILDDLSLNKKVRYAAFFTLCTYYRRYKDTSNFHRLLVKYDEFYEFATYDHLYSMFLQQRGNLGDLLTAIGYAQKAIDKAPKHSGLLHNFAQAVVTAVEEGEQIAEREPLLDRAKESLDKAILLENNYAKFYCTKGRLTAIQKSFPEAKQLIRTAIDKESSEREDYPLRVSDYQICLMRVQLDESSQKLELALNKGLQQIDAALIEVNRYASEERARNLEFLGFFAAVIALITSGTQLTQRPSVVESAQLIIIFTGALLIAFSGLSFLLHGLRKSSRSLTIFALGMITCIMGLVVVPRIL